MMVIDSPVNSSMYGSTGAGNPLPDRQANRHIPHLSGLSK